MHVPRFCLRIFQSNEGRAVTRKTAGMARSVGPAESSIQMHRSHPLPNTFTAILNTLWMCAHPDFKPESRVRGLVCPDLGLQTQSPVKITTSNLHFSLTQGKLSPLFPSSLSRQLACCCRSRGHSMGRQRLLPRCYQNTPHQEHPRAPSLSPNPRVFVRIGPLGSAQFGPRTNYESVGQASRRCLISLVRGI